MPIITTITLTVIAYLIGSTMSAYVVCKITGHPSPKTQGSGNPGATNVLRIAGKKAALITFLGDAIKGMIPVIIAHWFHASPSQLSIIALAAILGHIYPIFFGFQGGKGVSTTFGAALAIQPALGLLAIVTWLVVAVIFRYSSLAALISLISLPIWGTFTLDNQAFWPLCLITLLVLWRHRGNIKRLFDKREPKIGQNKT